MDDAKQKFSVGVFVIGSFIALLAVLFFLGMSNLFTRKAVVQTLFAESVQGLSVGSPVKYRGVPIGSVSGIAIRISDKLVQVNMEIELKHFVNVKGGSKAQRTVDFGDFFRSELREGMRCRLEFTGITGLRYVDFDYHGKKNDKIPVPRATLLAPSGLYIPAVSSPFRDLLQGISTSVERISKIDFEEISDELQGALKDISGLLSAPELSSTLDRIAAMSAHLEKVSGVVSDALDEGRLNRILNLLEKDLVAIDKAVQQLQENVENSKIPQSTEAFRAASESFVSGQQQLNNTMEKLNRALDSIKELSDYLNEDPSSLLSGKKKPPVKE